MKLRLGILFCAILFAQSCLSQLNEKNFKKLSVADGLIDNYITSLQQDSSGFIWAGTDVGLSRFDGNSFTNFTQGSPALPLNSSRIWKLKRFGMHLGILSTGGLQLLSADNFRLTSYTVPGSRRFIYLNAVYDAIQIDSSRFAINTSSGFYELDQEGVRSRHDHYTIKDVGKRTILFGREILQLSDSHLLVFHHRKRASLYDLKGKTLQELDSADVNWKMLFPKPGDHWVVRYQVSKGCFIFIPYAGKEIFYYDHGRKKLVRTPLTFQPGLQFGWESSITNLSDSTFAINTFNTGLYTFNLDRETGKINLSNRHLSMYKITCILKDREGRLWAGTNKGLLMQKMGNPFIRSFHYEDSNSPGGSFTSIYRYGDALYAGRYSFSNGLVIIDPVSMKTRKKISFFNDHNAWNEVTSIISYSKDTLWIGTTNGILWFNVNDHTYGKINAKPGLSKFVAILHPPDKNGYAWIINHLNGAVFRYHLRTRTFSEISDSTTPNIPFTRIKAAVYDSYGDVWLSGHSLARFNVSANKFDTVFSEYAGPNPFNDDIIVIKADMNGNLWIHNSSNGLLKYNIRDKKYNHFGVVNGLPGDVIQSLSDVVNEKIWLGGNSNLISLNIRTGQVNVFDQQDGLPETKPTARNIYFDETDRRFYMGSGDNLIVFDEEPVLRTISEPRILSVSINSDSIVFEPHNLDLLYYQNNLSISFTVVDFEKKNSRFYYRINNDTSWTFLNDQRSLNLSGLSPGKYLLQLMTRDGPGTEKITCLPIRINPPFWKKWWFISLLTLITAGCIILIFKRRLIVIERRSTIDGMLAQAEMKALHAQMNPHFIFNSLNSIREMILLEKNREASRYLAKFAALIRLTLDHSGRYLITLSENIQYLERYIEMERIRTSRFECRITSDIKEEHDEILIPPMLIQPFIENSIWHGMPATGDLLVNVHFSSKNNKLICIVDDNGVGLDQSVKSNGHESIGIKNIRNRLNLMNEKYNVESRVDMIDKSLTGKESGTTINLILPLYLGTNEKIKNNIG